MYCLMPSAEPTRSFIQQVYIKHLLCARHKYNICAGNTMWWEIQCEGITGAYRIMEEKYID